MSGSWSSTNPDTTPGAVCAELPSCNATGHSVRCPRGVAVVTIEQIVAADQSGRSLSSNEGTDMSGDCQPPEALLRAEREGYQRALREHGLGGYERAEVEREA